MSKSATAVAHPNIAFVKYWGNRDNKWTIPANGSISMNLAALETRTTVSYKSELDADELILNGQQITDETLFRVSGLLSQIRKMGSFYGYAQVKSQNNFPTGSGIASSASGFAALTFAAVQAAELQLDEKELSQLSRIGSGSACRSIPAGFVEWLAGTSHQDSYSRSIAPHHHWELIDHIAVISKEPKPISSLDGHIIADTSPLQNARVDSVKPRLDLCRQAILEKDFAVLAEVTELDSNMMHAVMMTSSPQLFYWMPATITVMQAVRLWRTQGLEVCYTIDAGANVHVISTKASSSEVIGKLTHIDGVIDIIISGVGGPAHIVE